MTLAPEPPPPECADKDDVGAHHTDEHFSKHNLDYAAISGLRATHPNESAYRLLTITQLVFALACITVICACLFLWPVGTLIAINAGTTFYFISAIMFRLYLLILGSGDKVAATPPPKISPDVLPIITILLPLYHDAEALPTLASAIDRLDYPAAKKDVKLILEADDPDTIHEAKRLGLDNRFDLIIAPPLAPRTKPKACNYGLYRASGELIVIYDAEDLPERDQLLKAAAAFQNRDTKLACVQARLNYYNPDDNWLTRGIMAQTPQEMNPYTPYILRHERKRKQVRPSGAQRQTRNPRWRDCADEKQAGMGGVTASAC